MYSAEDVAKMVEEKRARGEVRNLAKEKSRLVVRRAKALEDGNTEDAERWAQPSRAVRLHAFVNLRLLLHALLYDGSGVQTCPSRKQIEHLEPGTGNPSMCSGLEVSLSLSY